MGGASEHFLDCLVFGRLRVDHLLVEGWVLAQVTAFLFHFVGAVVGGVGVHLPVSAPYREPCQEVMKTDPGLAGILFGARVFI